MLTPLELLYLCVLMSFGEFNMAPPVCETPGEGAQLRVFAELPQPSVDTLQSIPTHDQAFELPPPPDEVHPDDDPLSDLERSNLYVSNLSMDVTDDELKLIFSRFGKILNSRIMVDIHTCKSRGFGFVQFSNPQEAAAAVSAMDGAVHHSQTMMVRIASQKTRQPGHLTPKIFIRNVPAGISEDEIRRFCSRFGVIQNCAVRPDVQHGVVTDRSTGGVSQVAYITFTTVGDAKKATFAINSSKPWSTCVHPLLAKVMDSNQKRRDKPPGSNIDPVALGPLDESPHPASAAQSPSTFSESCGSRNGAIFVSPVAPGPSSITALPHQQTTTPAGSFTPTIHVGIPGNANYTQFVTLPPHVPPTAVAPPPLPQPSMDNYHVFLHPGQVLYGNNSVNVQTGPATFSPMYNCGQSGINFLPGVGGTVSMGPSLPHVSPSSFSGTPVAAFMGGGTPLSFLGTPPAAFGTPHGMGGFQPAQQWMMPSSSTPVCLQQQPL